MTTQNQIKRTLSTPENIAYIKQRLDSKEITHRTALAKEICQHYNFYDLRGEMQIASCVKALRRLEAQSHFALPASRTKRGKKSPHRLLSAVPEPIDVPSEVSGIESLQLVLVRSDEQMSIWNELMIREHPLGDGPLVGRQLRYLIESEHGWLGGFGFAASALHLADRDKWIGWDKEQRLSHLDQVVCMSRFLLRPNVKCRHLASRVLSMSTTRLADDFYQKYHYRPCLIESFVDLAHYQGTSYRAANWIQIGHTKGRGRQDRYSKASLSRKAIVVFPLEKDFREKLGVTPGAGACALGVADGLDGEQWAEHEFGGAPLGDKRLSHRLVKVATAKAAMPSRAFCGVAQGDWPAAKAYYRMIDQPDTSSVTLPNILAPHRQRTIQRMMSQKTVLCIQDGSELNYTNLEKCTGLGELKANQTGAKMLGLNLHSTFAVTTNGLPLGVLKAQCQAPKIKVEKDRRKPSAIPIEEKKTYAWIEHHRDLVEISRHLTNTRLVDVCDREADFFEFFDEQRQNPSVDLLIRAKHDRKLPGEPFKLFASVRQARVQSRILLPVSQQSARSKKSKQKARAARPKRMAEMALRHQTIEFPPPEYYADKQPITLELIHAVEENPPADTQPIEWFLLTTVNINSAADIEQCLRWYALRWRIEDWHRVLKSGCSIDDLRHETAERLSRAIAINLVIGWRIMLMTLMGRETPELPAELLFSDVEIRTLRAYAKKKETDPPLLLGEAVLIVAKIGGYLNRKSDPAPGHQIMWMGYTGFQHMCTGYELVQNE